MNHNIKSFTLHTSFIEYPQFLYALKRIREMHDASRLSKKGKGIAILGPSGVGKTTVLHAYIRDYLAKSPSIGVGAKPILFVEVPSTPTPKSLGAAVLMAMGDQFAARGSAEEKLSRIITLMNGLQTEMIIFDEAQHLVERRRTPTGATTDWLKNLLNATRVAVVLAGLKKTEDLLLSNEQLRRRFSATAYYDRFNIGDKYSKKVFLQLLNSFQNILPVKAIKFVSEKVSLRFYQASFGLIDYLIKIIDRAVWLVQSGAFAEIDQTVLAQAFRDEVWSLAPDYRNPFCESFNNINLTGRFEPFEDFEIKAA